MGTGHLAIVVHLVDTVLTVPGDLGSLSNCNKLGIPRLPRLFGEDSLYGILNDRFDPATELGNWDEGGISMHCHPP